MPLPAIGGGPTGVGGLIEQAGGHWLGSHLISARPPRLVRDDHNWTCNHDVGLALAGGRGAKLIMAVSDSYLLSNTVSCQIL